MPKPRSQFGPSPHEPTAATPTTTTTTTTTTTPSKPAATPTAIFNVWALICLFVWFECKEKKVGKTDEIERICFDLASKHVAMFVAGSGIYDHPACTTMRNDFAFSPEEIMKTSNGKTIQKKGQQVERDIKNLLIPTLYKSSLLDPPNYTIASGKNEGDLLLDMKRNLWEKNGKKAEAFENGKMLNTYHPSFFPFLVASPLSDYVYSRPCHPFFKSCDKRLRELPAASASAASAQKKRGRIAQREEDRGKKPRDSPVDDFPGSASAMAFVDADERKTRSDILMFLVKEGNPRDKEMHLQALTKLAYSKKGKMEEEKEKENGTDEEQGGDEDDREEEVNGEE